MEGKRATMMREVENVCCELCVYAHCLYCHCNSHFSVIMDTKTQTLIYCYLQFVRLTPQNSFVLMEELTSV